MFDFSFWEMAVVGVVALIVFGPEKLPGLARTAGLWLGRAKRMVANVRDDIEREIKAEELKRVMEQQARASGLHEIVEEGRHTLDGLKEELESSASAATTPQADPPAANPNPTLTSEPAPAQGETKPDQNTP